MAVDPLGTVRYSVDRGRGAYRNRAIGCYVAAGVVAAVVAMLTGAEFYRQGPMVLVGMLVLALREHCRGAEVHGFDPSGM